MNTDKAKEFFDSDKGLWDLFNEDERFCNLPQVKEMSSKTLFVLMESHHQHRMKEKVEAVRSAINLLQGLQLGNENDFDSVEEAKEKLYKILKDGE